MSEQFKAEAKAFLRHMGTLVSTYAAQVVEEIGDCHDPRRPLACGFPPNEARDPQGYLARIATAQGEDQLVALARRHVRAAHVYNAVQIMTGTREDVDRDEAARSIRILFDHKNQYASHEKAGDKSEYGHVHAFVTKHHDEICDYYRALTGRHLGADIIACSSEPRQVTAAAK